MLLRTGKKQVDSPDLRLVQLNQSNKFGYPNFTAYIVV